MDCALSKTELDQLEKLYSKLLNPPPNEFYCREAARSPRSLDLRAPSASLAYRQAESIWTPETLQRRHSEYAVDSLPHPPATMRLNHDPHSANRVSYCPHNTMRRIAFYLCLFIPIAGWAAVVLPTYFGRFEDLPYIIVKTCIDLSPVVAGDLSLFGEITPVVLAGAIIALMPPAKQNVDWGAAALALLTYFLYIQLNVFFVSGPGAGLIASIGQNEAADHKTVSTFVSNVESWPLW